MRARGKEKEKQCTYCERTFTKEEHLRRHERSHTGEKPFKCHKCSRKYGRSDVLARHLLTHPLDDLAHAQSLNSSSGNGAETSPRHPGDIGHTSQEGVVVRKDQNMALPSERDPLTMSNQEQQLFTMFSTTFPPPAHHQTPSKHSSLLPRPTTSDPSFSVSGSKAQPPTSASDRVETAAATRNVNMMSWSPTTHEEMGGVSRQDWDILLPAPEPGPEDIPAPNTALARGGSAALADRSPSALTNGSQLSFWQIMQDQGALGAPSRGNGVQEDFSNQQLENPSTQFAVASCAEKQSLLFQSGDMDLFESDPFVFDGDFGVYGYVRPWPWDYVEFPETPRTPPQNPPRAHEEQITKPDILFSVDQVQQMRKLWRGQRSRPCKRIGPSLWQTLVQHPADNIFSRPTVTDSDQSRSESGGPGNPRWSLDEDRRKSMIDFCNEIDETIYREDLADLTPHSTPHNAETDNGGLPLGLAADGFPTKEVLDASLDLFFQCAHLPFIHKATFDARTTPPSLLLPMCLVGLSSLHPERFKAVVLRYQKKLMRYCRSELTAKALGRCQPWDLLLAIASTLLVVYLGLSYLEDLDECQAHMLAVQMLHIAEKHGLFAASEGRDLASQLQAGPTDRESSWKAWGRAESVKRMTSCLLWMDMAYTRLMTSAGVIDVDKVELHLPCESALFDATTSTRFLQLAQRGAQLMGPRIGIQNFVANPPTTLNHLSMETFLVALYLQVAASRHKLPVGNYAPLEARSHNPAEVFSKNAKARDVVASLLLLPAKYENLFRQRHKVTAFAWNNVCIALTADLDLLEIATGRDGLESARTAIVAVTKWSKTPGARRAALHAAQLFDILSSSRLSESNIARPDLLLFHSALVLSMYLFVSNHVESDDDCMVFELRQNIDWAIIGPEGLRGSTSTNPPSPNTEGCRSKDAAYAARDFIRYGGAVSFSGEVLLGGGATARKILLNYVRLLDAVGKWWGSRYSQLLRTMSDFVIEGSH